MLIQLFYRVPLVGWETNLERKYFKIVNIWLIFATTNKYKNADYKFKPLIDQSADLILLIYFLITQNFGLINIYANIMQPKSQCISRKEYNYHESIKHVWNCVNNYTKLENNTYLYSFEKIAQFICYWIKFWNRKL